MIKLKDLVTGDEIELHRLEQKICIGREGDLKTSKKKLGVSKRHVIVYVEPRAVNDNDKVRKDYRVRVFDILSSFGTRIKWKDGSEEELDSMAGYNVNVGDKILLGKDRYEIAVLESD